MSFTGVSQGGIIAIGTGSYITLNPCGQVFYDCTKLSLHYCFFADSTLRIHTGHISKIDASNIRTHSNF